MSDVYQTSIKDLNTDKQNYTSEHLYHGSSETTQIKVQNSQDRLVVLNLKQIS